MQIEEYILPTHWASALINGDDSGLEGADECALDRFISDMLAEHGAVHCLDMSNDDIGFMRYHDAQPYGVLACDCSTFSFDVTPRDS